MLDFNHLYHFAPENKRTALCVYSRKAHVTDEIDPDALATGKLTPNDPVVFEYERGSGSKALAIVDAGIGLNLISQRVVDVLRGFTGWRTFPVEVYGKKKEHIPGYYGLSVTGRCGPIDNSHSRPTWRKPIVPTGPPRHVWVGMYFSDQTWDESDIFIPDDTLLIVVTEEVKKALEAEKITNVKFGPLSERENSRIMSSVGLRHPPPPVQRYLDESPVFYRNRLAGYLVEGMSEEEAEFRALKDVAREFQDAFGIPFEEYIWPEPNRDKTRSRRKEK